MKLRKGDTVMIISGKDRNRRGTIEKVLPKSNKIIVTGINVTKQHLKPSRKNPHGGIINILAPINISKAMIVCPHCGKITRIGYKISEKSKERICRGCKGCIEVKNE